MRGFTFRDFQLSLGTPRAVRFATSLMYAHRRTHIHTGDCGTVGPVDPYRDRLGVQWKPRGGNVGQGSREKPASGPFTCLAPPDLSERAALVHILLFCFCSVTFSSSGKCLWCLVEDGPPGEDFLEHSPLLAGYS